MLVVRPSNDRGYFDRGWLKSFHSFSFGQYFDPEHMGFSVLRVINDDQIARGAGFGMHAHQDMEIITYMLKGKLRHQDSVGNSSVIEAGDVQRMTAGTGIEHSEMNADHNAIAHLLQIWIKPAILNLTPSYQEQRFSATQKKNQWCLIVSPNQRNGSIKIHQDVNIYASQLDVGHSLHCAIDLARASYLQVATGAVSIDDLRLHAGDAVMARDFTDLRMTATEDSELLWFDLPA